MAKRILANLAVFLALAGAYFGAGKLGLSLAFLNASASPVWAPTGLALAAMLLLGYRIWPAVFVGSFLVNLTTAGNAWTSLAIAGGNTLEAVLGAALAWRFSGGRASFEHVENIVRFVFFAAAPSTALSATVGVTALAAGGYVAWDSYNPVWFTWWTGDFISTLTVAPLLLIWAGRAVPRLDARLGLEAALLIVTVCALSAVIFGGVLRGPVRQYPLEYLSILPLLWAAFRFYHHGAITATTLTCAIAIWGTLRGYGAFAVDEPNISLLLLQAFMGVATLTALILACVVADRARGEHELRQHEQHMTMALNSGRMGTWQWDIAGGRVTWSPRLEEIHGLNPGEFSGTFDAFLEDVHREDVEHVKASIGRTLAKASEHEIEYRLSLKNGQVRWVEGRGQFVVDQAGKPLRLVGVCKDVTDRKRAEMEREELLAREREARAQAEHANTAKDQFLAILSHELRTPLTPVMLTASLLESSAELPEQFRDDISTIRRNIELEARLIDDLLDLTKVARGKMKLQLETADIHLLVRRAIAICCPEAERDIETDFMAARPLVRADPARLQQVFWNLLRNAVKFAPPQTPILVRSRNESDGQIAVEIVDGGPGIEPELLPRLFTPFVQGEAARSGKTGGLGLGLAISKALVSSHGGTLEARSNHTRAGATFVVRLPVATGFSESTPGEPAPGGEARLESRSLSILLVEDHESTLVVMRKLLSGHGHRVTTATSNASALRAAEQDSFDLVISDLGLPDGLGYDLMSALRDRWGVRGIALSGYGAEADIQRSKAAGFAEHLTKPVDFDTLIATIKRVTSDLNPTAGAGAVLA